MISSWQVCQDLFPVFCSRVFFKKGECLFYFLHKQYIFSLRLVCMKFNETQQGVQVSRTTATINRRWMDELYVGEKGKKILHMV